MGLPAVYGRTTFLLSALTPVLHLLAIFMLEGGCKR